ncbi:tripartite tricarboxylate transporter permease, partial [Acetomicrobium sp. S15 = DSM 107314]|uniref:tripartite tricarboxylate transporter permease n=1 Tax=Acetomicrobium sp. S15 = DSM 107314 TaxID=2529858 RepID=UPI00406C82D4
MATCTEVLESAAVEDHFPALRDACLSHSDWLIRNRATVGLDPFSVIVRFGFGTEQLIHGFELIPFYMGIFALSQVLYRICEGRPRYRARSVQWHFGSRRTGFSRYRRRPEPGIG